MGSAREVLLRCLELVEGSASSAPFVDVSDAEWDRVVCEAHRQGLASLLYRRLAMRSTPISPPPAWFTFLERTYYCGVLRSRWISSELSGILRMLRHRGIPVIVLKGAHLAYAVYQEPSLRPMGDVDLLLRPHDLDAAEAALLADGYARVERAETDVDYAVHHHTCPLLKPGGLAIELHRALSTHPGLADARGAWLGAAPVDIVGERVLALSPEHLLLHLCVHAAYNHRFDVQLVHLFDIVATMRRFRTELEWPCLRAIARESGVAGLVYCALRVAHDLLEPEVAAGEIEALSHDQQDVEAIAAVRRFLMLETGTAPDAYRLFQVEHTLRGKLRVLRGIVMPSPDHLRRSCQIPLGQDVTLRYYARNLVRLLRSRTRAALEILRRSERVRAAEQRERSRSAVDRWIDATSVDASRRFPFAAS